MPESAYETHLRATHKEFEDTAEAEKHGAHSRQLPQLKVSTRPICRDEIRYPELIRTHIGRHQAQLGLWPLRGMRYFDDEDGQKEDEEDEENCAESIDEDEAGQIEKEEGRAIKVEKDVDEQGRRREEDETKPSQIPSNSVPSQDTVAAVGKGLEEQDEQTGPNSPLPGSTETEPVFSHSDYIVGRICALQIEFVAAVACLDARHKPLPYPSVDDNKYQLGQIGSHNIVIGSRPSGENGPDSAAVVAAYMRHSFPQMRFGVLVGIGGGAPSSDHDIRLGDIAVSYPEGTHGGVIQLDRGKQLQNGVSQLVGHLNQPPPVLLSTVAYLRTERGMESLGLERDIQSIVAKNPQLRNHYSRPDSSSDRLYLPSYIHASDGPCELDCDAKYEIARRKWMRTMIAQRCTTV